jgi:hypothetical protein
VTLKRAATTVRLEVDRLSEMSDILNLYKLVLAFAVLMCSGCMSVGPVGEPGFSAAIHRDLAIPHNDRAVLSSRATLLQGTYGYKGHFEANFLGFKGTLVDGVLICTNERLIYSVWDDDERQYVPLLEAPYVNITRVTVKEFGLGKRLVVLANGTFYTFEATGESGLAVDGEKTVEIYKFVASKIRRAAAT